MTEVDLHHMLGRLAERLTPGDLDHTLTSITEAAVEVLPGVHFASITVKHADDRLETVAPTDPLLREIDARQYELREGPCYAAAVDTTYITSANLAADERFPNYGDFAASRGIRSQAGIRLFHTPPPTAHGALNLYSKSVGSFDDMSMVSRLFAHQSGIALDYAREVSGLQEAVKSRQLVGQAVGIVMERYGLTEQRAFAFLARVSQTRNVKLRVIAQELISAAEGQDAPSGST